MKINSKNILTILIALIMILSLGSAVMAQDGELSISQTLPAEIYQNDNNGRYCGRCGNSVVKDTAATEDYDVSIDQDIINRGNQKEFSFTLENAENDSTINYTISDGDSNTEDITGTVEDVKVDEDGNVKVEGIDVSGLEDGELTLTATLTDEAGNEGEEKTDRVNKDTGAPDLNVEDKETNNTTPTITGTSDQPDREVTVTVDGKDYTTTTDGNGNWSVDIPEENELPEGDYTVEAKITDDAGNTTTAEGNLEIDLTEPEIALDNNDIVTNNQTPTISGTSDQPEDSDVEVVITDGDDNEVFSGTTKTDTDGNWSIDVPDNIAEGEYTVKAKTKDEAGNSATVNGDLEIDITPPDLTVDDKTTNDTTPTITGETDQLDGSQVTVTVDGKEYTTTTDENGNWSVDIPEENELPEGDYTVEAEITDEAGNKTTDNATLRISTSEPVIETNLSTEHDTRKPGEENSYQLDISNNGKTEVNNLTVTTPIPAGFELEKEKIELDGKILSSDQFEIDGNNLIIKVSQLDKGETINLNLPGIISKEGQEVVAGSIISTKSRVTYNDILNNVYEQYTDQVRLEILAYHEIEINPDRTLVANSNSKAIFAHTVKNNGNSLEKVTLSLDGLFDYQVDWYYDINFSKDLELETDQLIAASAKTGVELSGLAPGETANILIAVNIDKDAAISQESFKVTAASKIKTEVNDQVDNKLNILEIKPVLSVNDPDKREYQYAGESYQLEIEYGNDGNKLIENPVLEIKISEEIDQSKLDPALNFDSETNTIRIEADDLEAGENRSLELDLTLKNNTEQGTEIVTKVEFIQNNLTLLQEKHSLVAANEDPSIIDLEAEPEVIRGDGESRSTLTATITDLIGNFVEDGTEVEFKIPDSRITVEEVEDYPTSSSQSNDIVTANVETIAGLAQLEIIAPKIASDEIMEIPIDISAENKDTGIVRERIYIVFSPGALIGTIIDASTGLPRTGTEIQLRQDGKILKTARTDANGRYSFVIEEDGDYEIYVNNEDESGSNQIIKRTFASSGEGQITFAPRIIEGRIYYEESNQPIANEEVKIYNPAGELVDTVISNENGRYTYEIKKQEKQGANFASALINRAKNLFKVREQNGSDKWTVTALSGKVKRGVSEPESGVTSLNNNLPVIAATNSGQVVDKSNQSNIENAEITLVKEDGSIVDNLPEINNTEQDNPYQSADGSYNFQDVSPVSYYLTAEADGYYDYQSDLIELSNQSDINQLIEMQAIENDDLTIEKESDLEYAVPGEEVKYTISITNNSDQIMNELIVTDNLPEELLYNQDSADPEVDYSSGELKWTIEELESKSTMKLNYTVTVAEDAEMGNETINQVKAELNEFEFNPVRHGLQLSPPDLIVNKTAAEEKVVIGDFVSYKLEIINESEFDVEEFTLYDKLPAGFKYVKDSAVMISADGQKSSVNPVGSRTINWEGLEIAAESSFEVRYSLVVGSGVDSYNSYLNQAYAMFEDQMISNTAEAEVLVIEDPLFNTSTVIGKVYLDQNEDRMQTEAEKGLAGIRIISTTGQIVETDKFGRFHFEIKAEDNIQPMQTLVLKLDKDSLPAGAEVISKNPVIVKIREGLMSEVNYRIKKQE